MEQFPEESWRNFQKALQLKEAPLGIYYTNEKPEGITPKEGITRCMIGLLQEISCSISIAFIGNPSR